jgi:hypothetical protein
LNGVEDQGDHSRGIHLELYFAQGVQDKARTSKEIEQIEEQTGRAVFVVENFL